MKLLFVLSSLCLMPALLYAESDCMPYAGEQLTFDVGWEFINAGVATMTVSTPSEGSYKIHTAARTNKFLDIFKKVRDIIVSEGICLDGAMQSTHFNLEQHERSYHAIKKTVFDWQHDAVFYTQNKKTDRYDVSAGHLNVMDAFFRVRSEKLLLGDSFNVPVFDSRETYDVIVNIGKKTKMLRAPWGEHVECISIEPILKTAGMFSSKGKMKIWVTNDSRHIPIKLIAKIKIGHIVGTLIDYKEPR
ncbi:MAG: DUF3108 domain-containing protein [Mariprofundaceae bacterium]|nr:DUF3108 domain-containing protein [Mariprofundaceae bacterium]